MSIVVEWMKLLKAGESLMKDKDKIDKAVEDEKRKTAGKCFEAELRYRTLFEQSPDGILIIDTNGNFIDFNNAAHNMLGYTREEFKQLRISDINLDDAEKIKACIERLLRDGKANFEVKYKAKDGGRRSIQVFSQVMALSGESFFHSIWQDITERKQVEEALRKSEKFVRDILETVDEGFIVIDRDYKIISANKAYLDQVKIPLENVIGRHCYEISHHITVPCHKVGEGCSVKHTFDTGEPHTKLHIHHDKEKNPIYVETKSYPLKDASGHIISAIEIINNNTGKKKLEDQLRHSQKMEAVGQLAGGVAHDFNNILTAITGYGSLMKMKMSEHDPLRNYLQQMLDASERAANLTRSLLAFSRKQVISPRPVNLNKIIKNVEKLLRRLISEDVEMKVILTNKDLTVMADSSQIEQILMNLVANASDAMLERGCLTISTEVDVLDHEFVRMNGFGKPGMYALFSVTDTGTGMDEKTKRKIFEPFFTTKQAGRGTGLGLSIAYGIVKQHDGYITCYSEPNMGTTFKIYLPMIKRKTAKKERTALHPVSSGTETILVSEDDAAVSKIMKEVLEQFGYAVIEAVDGEDAISKFKNNRDRVKLLILDVIMPKKNGKEVYEEIRKDRPDVKVIFSSGYMTDILQKKGALEGDLNFIPKPVSPTELLRKVRETLDKG
jgi:two-component system cell cycle sensor histidine kinase/response regulator CckA